MIILVGFENEEVELIKNNVNEKIRVVSKEEEDETLENIIKMEKQPGYEPLGEDRVVIMHELEKEKIRELIGTIRKIIPSHLIFATTTPTSLKWKIGNLIQELKEEDRYFRRTDKY